MEMMGILLDCRDLNLRRFQTQEVVHVVTCTHWLGHCLLLLRSCYPSFSSAYLLYLGCYSLIVQRPWFWRDRDFFMCLLYPFPPCYCTLGWEAQSYGMHSSNACLAWNLNCLELFCSWSTSFFHQANLGSYCKGQQYLPSCVKEKECLAGSCWQAILAQVSKYCMWHAAPFWRISAVEGPLMDE